MFEVKKIISSFLLPPGIFIFFGILLSVYFLKIKKKKLFIVSLLFSFALYLFSINFFINLLICPLERDLNQKASYDGDVILFLSGGTVNFIDDITGSNYLSESSLERLFTVYRIHKKTSLPIILTGGKLPGFQSDAEVAFKFLTLLGVDKEKIFYENRSLNTYENAIYSKEICQQKGFKKPILITDSLHIPRSVYSFKKVGFKEVAYYPSSYTCRGKISLYDFLPQDFSNQRKFSHELLGLIFYRIFY
ncbi:MAG: YdcF family protein [Elusimicrobiota bacterium]